MRVVLKTNVPGLGKGGDVVVVKDGYARNHLIPKGLALTATDKNERRLKHDQEVIAGRIKKELAEAGTLAQRIAAISLTIAKRVGENERLFGSVTTKEIEDALREEGVVMDRRNILLEQPLKQLGVYDVPVRLHSEVTATLKVWVVAK